ncbi:MAG: pyruvate dehydrogenase complex dihydrolipoamide acetyltransferase [Alphaproteobacteria bacterium]|nr:pyruvate dehydrogenase complex dihydrolipoamide acetyltransferase [Alphaproteobacteria bacterium]
MTIDITMPALSPTMTEGAVAKWHKKEGDAVKSGDVIAEIETDKATVEVEASDDGVMGKIVVPEGTKGVKVNDLIAVLLEEGESADSIKGGAKPAPKAPPAAAAPAPAAAPQPQAAATAPAPPAPPQANGGGDRIFASPLARRMAEKAGIDLTSLKGSGPHGRIVKSDIDAARGQAPAAAAPSQAVAPQAKAPPPAPTAGLPSFTEVPHTTMRKVIAQRLVQSKREAPHFYLTMDCQIDKLLALRKELNSRPSAEGPHGYKLSVNDFVLRAVALAMKKVPAANASWTETAVRIFHGVDVSVAVAIPNGLITPVIRGAEGKGLAEISHEMKALAEKARAGKLTPEEYQGGTVSVSNLGMYGVRDFAAVINPPQGCILAVGAGEPRPVVKDGAIAIATVMSCTLSVDHRVVDGAVGAEFLGAFKQLIEDPMTMLL